MWKYYLLGTVVQKGQHCKQNINWKHNFLSSHSLKYFANCHRNFKKSTAFLKIIWKLSSKLKKKTLQTKINARYKQKVELLQTKALKILRACWRERTGPNCKLAVLAVNCHIFWNLTLNVIRTLVYGK